MILLKSRLAAFYVVLFVVIALLSSRVTAPAKPIDQTILPSPTTQNVMVGDQSP